MRVDSFWSRFKKVILRGRQQETSGDGEVIKSFKTKLIAGSMFVSTAMIAMPLAEAAVVNSHLITVGNNDCSGVYGQPDTACNVTYTDPVTGQTTQLSPIIAKYDSKTGFLNEGFINTGLFPSVAATDFSISVASTGNGGSWSYNPTGNDPAIRYWVVKQSNDFTLYWETAVACTYSLTCLQSALPVTSGTWFTDFSHLSFYDTRIPPQNVVPLPGAAVLFISGLAGLGLLGRVRARKQTASA